MLQKWLPKDDQLDAAENAARKSKAQKGAGAGKSGAQEGSEKVLQLPCRAEMVHYLDVRDGGWELKECECCFDRAVSYRAQRALNMMNLEDFRSHLHKQMPDSVPAAPPNRPTRAILDHSARNPVWAVGGPRGAPPPVHYHWKCERSPYLCAEGMLVEWFAEPRVGVLMDLGKIRARIPAILAPAGVSSSSPTHMDSYSAAFPAMAAALGAGRQAEQDSFASALVQILGVKERGDLKEGFGFFLQELLSGGLEKAHAEGKGRGAGRGAGGGGAGRGAARAGGRRGVEGMGMQEIMGAMAGLMESEGGMGAEERRRLKGEPGMIPMDAMMKMLGDKDAMRRLTQMLEAESGGNGGDNEGESAGGDDGGGEGKDGDWREKLTGAAWERLVPVNSNAVVAAFTYRAGCILQWVRIYGSDFISAKKCFKDDPQCKVLPMRHPLRDLPSLLVRLGAIPKPLEGRTFPMEWEEWPQGDEAAVKLPCDPSERCFRLGLVDESETGDCGEGGESGAAKASACGYPSAAEPAWKRAEQLPVFFLLHVAIHWPKSLLQIEELEAVGSSEGAEGVRRGAGRKVQKGKKGGKKGGGDGGEDGEDDGEVWEEVRGWCLAAMFAWKSTLRVVGPGMVETCKGGKARKGKGSKWESGSWVTGMWQRAIDPRDCQKAHWPSHKLACLLGGKVGGREVDNVGGKSSRPQGKKNKVQDAAPPSSPRHRITKKARHAYTAREKLYWLDMLDTQPDLSIRGLARLANVQPKQIREWRKLKERLLVSAACRRRLVGAGQDGSQDHLILAHMRDSGEVEVLEDVMEEEQDELVPNPFYPAPVVTPPDVTVEMEEEAVLAAEAEEADEEAVPAKSDSSESDDGNSSEADEWSDDGDEWWAPGRYEGAEVEEWVAGDEDE
ncbi:unnamed protein product [Closterium sp. Naga37s-1]|nr:unnamed protein product [Closterium sp. Naga37s-1]